MVKVSWLAGEKSPSSQEELATNHYVLAELLELIAVICECCGNFMTSRFTKDVWPTIARYLGSIIQKESHQRVISPEVACVHFDTTSRETDGCNISEAERRLILSTLDCLGRVFDVLDLSETVLSAAALTLLPYLDTRHFGPNIGEKAMLTMMRLADANYDVLLRPLLQLLEAHLPPFPMNFTHVPHFAPVGVRPNSDQAELIQKAVELLFYIKCSPEQAIY